MSLAFEATLGLGRFQYDAAFTADGEILVLFGHSGAGKSLSLQLVAGLLRPHRGRIAIDGQTVVDTEAGVFVPPQQRRTGYVVQDFALFPHMSVLDNVMFGMEHGDGKRARAQALIERLGLAGYGDRRPDTLSGGQQQRVALARALGREARVMLLDEPFSALDETLRQGLREELLRLRAELGLTIVFVTHDLREAHLLADHIAVFDAGRVLQWGSRESVFRRPQTARVAELTGVANILEGTVVAPDGDRVLVECCSVPLLADASALGVPSAGDRVKLAIRAERVNLRRTSALPRGLNEIPARIVHEQAYGNTHLLDAAGTSAAIRLRVELAARPYEVLDVASRKDWILELPAGDLVAMPS